MLETDEGGTTKKARLLQYEKTTGVTPQLLLDQPDLDIRVEPFYRPFLSLNSYRHVTLGGMGGAVHQVLTAREILDWMRLECCELSAFGLRVVRALDVVYVNFKNKPPKKTDEDKKKPNGKKGRRL